MRGWAVRVLVLLGCGCAGTLGPVPGVVAYRQHAAVACPLDHSPVEVPSVLLGDQTGVRFDLRPNGEGLLLRPLARCGRCGLVFVPEAEEKPEAVEALRKAVASPRYQSLKAHPSDRLLRAVVLDEARAAIGLRARAWLEASWELEGVEEPRRRESQELALAAYREVAATTPREVSKAAWVFDEGHGDAARTADLIQVELLRQLSRFEEAARALEAVASRPEFSRTVYARLVPLERELVAARDAQPHPIPALGPIEWKDDNPDVVEARALAGWNSFSAEFTLERATKGSVNGEPQSLMVAVKSKGRRAIDQAWWWNLVDAQGRPRSTWADFLALYRSAESVVSRHPWLAAWRDADEARRIELHAVGTETWSGDLQRDALKRWAHAGLPGAPRVELLLRSGRSICGAVYLDGIGEAGLVLRASGCIGGDWSDWLQAPPGSYLLVRPDGRRERRTLPVAPASSSGDAPR